MNVNIRQSEADGAAREGAHLIGRQSHAFKTVWCGRFVFVLLRFGVARHRQAKHLDVVVYKTGICFEVATKLGGWTGHGAFSGQ